eukprot:COSAG02_NODE_34423_length_484_cov_0.940260_1_plen_23_part_01
MEAVMADPFGSGSGSGSGGGLEG